MRYLVAVLAVAGSVAGCGGTSPVAYCSDFETELCVRTFECTPSDVQATTDFQNQYGASPAQCAAMFKASYCAAVTNDHPCATGAMSYHSDKADACVADLKAASCPTIASGFQSDNCSAVCS
jgi:hypothetical protein